MDVNGKHFVANPSDDQDKDNQDALENDGSSVASGISDGGGGFSKDSAVLVKRLGQFDGLSGNGGTSSGLQNQNLTRNFISSVMLHNILNKLIISQVEDIV